MCAFMCMDVCVYVQPDLIPTTTAKASAGISSSKTVPIGRRICSDNVEIELKEA